MKKGYILISDTPRGQFRVTYVGKNGEKLAQSEALESVAAVVKNIMATYKSFHPHSTWRVTSVSGLNDFHQRCLAKVVYKGKNQNLNKHFSNK